MDPLSSVVECLGPKVIRFAVERVRKTQQFLTLEEKRPQIVIFALTD